MYVAVLLAVTFFVPTLHDAVNLTAEFRFAFNFFTAELVNAGFQTPLEPTFLMVATVVDFVFTAAVRVHAAPLVDAMVSF